MGSRPEIASREKCDRNLAARRARVMTGRHQRGRYLREGPAKALAPRPAMGIGHSAARLRFTTHVPITRRLAQVTVGDAGSSTGRERPGLNASYVA
jgi:hypothetical protein